MDARYYVYHHEQQTGPLTAEELRALFAREGLGADVYVCREGDADWSRAGDMAELGDFVASPPPAAAEEAPSADVHAAVPATSGEPETIAAAADGTERAAAAEPLPAASASGAATAAGAVSTAPASMRGFRRRLLKWGTVAAGILLTVGAVGGAAFYYHTHRTTDFATLVGFDTSTYYECNLNNITEREVRQISEALAYAGKKLDFAPPELLVHKLGIRCAYAACGPAPSTEDNPPPLLVALEVHNLQETLKLFRRLQERAKKETESRGGDADNERTQREFSDWELDEGNKPCYIGLANKGNILLISTDADILENAINRYEGNDRSPSLADNPQYREAVAARPAQADFFSYSDLPRMLKEQEARLSVLFREQPALLELKKKYIDPLRTSYGYGIRDGEYACMESVMLLAEDCRWAQTLADARCEFPPQSEAHNLFRLSVALPRGWSQPVSTKLQELVDNRHRQKLMECQGALGALHSALYLYQTDVGRFPDRLEQLERDRAPGWSGPYLARQILDPWGGTISYQSDGYDYAAVVLYAEEPLAWYASDVDRLIFAEDAEERIRRADQPIDVAQRLDQVRELAFVMPHLPVKHKDPDALFLLRAGNAAAARLMLKDLSRLQEMPGVTRRVQGNWLLAGNSPPLLDNTARALRAGNAGSDTPVLMRMSYALALRDLLPEQHLPNIKFNGEYLMRVAPDRILSSYRCTPSPLALVDFLLELLMAMPPQHERQTAGVACPPAGGARMVPVQQPASAGG